MAILEFPEPTAPHLTGKARCLQCEHEWISVSPVGVDALECPECNTLHGVFIYPTEPKTEQMWECSCGSNLFFLLDTHELQCYKCGTCQTF